MLLIHFSSSFPPIFQVSARLLEPGGHIFTALSLSLAAFWPRALASLPCHADVTTRNALLAACADGADGGWQAALVILKTLQQEKVADVISYTTAISDSELILCGMLPVVHTTSH